MRESFSKIIGFTLEKEGYKTDDPKDPGKLTIWGISSVYHPIEVAKMARMSKEEAFKYASELYLKKYWIQAGCDNLPWPKDVILFEIAVNPGFKLVQKIMSGPRTWQDFLLDRESYHRDRVREKPYKKIFFGGWINRTLDLRDLIMRAIK